MPLMVALSTKLLEKKILLSLTRPFFSHKNKNRTSLSAKISHEDSNNRLKMLKIHQWFRTQWCKCGSDVTLVSAIVVKDEKRQATAVIVN